MKRLYILLEAITSKIDTITRKINGLPNLDGQSLTDNLLTTTTHTVDIGTLSSGGYLNKTTSITRSGYYPLGVVGFNANGTGSSSLYLSECYIWNMANGSCDIHTQVRMAPSTSGSSITVNVVVLWMKTNWVSGGGSQ